VIPTLLLTAAVPAVVAALFLSLAVMTRDKGSWRHGAACGALAIGFGYLVGHAAASPSEALEHLPRTSSELPLIFAPLALLIGLAESTWGRVAPLRWILRIGFLGLGALAVFCAFAQPEPDTWLRLTLAGALGIIFLLGLDGLTAIAGDRGSLSTSTGLVAVTGACAVVILIGNDVFIAQLGGVLAATLVGVAFMSWRYPTLTPLYGAVAPLGLLLWLLVVLGCFLNELSPGSAALLALLPGALWLGASGRLAKVAPGNSYAAGAVVTGLLAVAAAGLAHIPAPF
jgi:hypothetical protein